MSNDQIDEYEQGERVRKWLRENGGSVLGGIAIGLASIAGFQTWQGREDAQRVEASRQYESFLVAQEAGQANEAEGLATLIANEYGDTPYPALAALRRSASLVAEDRIEDALKALEAALPGTSDPTLAQLLQLRAARAEVQLGRFDQAVARLASVEEPSFRAIREEIRGDAMAAQGRRDDARAAYLDAMTATDIASPARLLLELKLADAGGTTNTPEA